MSTALLIAALAFAPPTDVPSAADTALRTVDVNVDDARRQRFVANGIEAGVGAAQLSLGVAALTTLEPRGPAVQRIAIKQVVAGTAALGVGLTFLVLPSPLERLQRTPEYDRLRRSPDDPSALAAFERTWQRKARVARALRLVSGSITLAAGVGVTAWGSASLGLDDPNGREGGATWGVATVNAGLLLMAAGIVDLALRAPIERAWRDYRYTGGGRAPRVQARFGGTSLSLRF